MLNDHKLFVRTAWLWPAALVISAAFALSGCSLLSEDAIPRMTITASTPCGDIALESSAKDVAAPTFDCSVTADGTATLTVGAGASEGASSRAIAAMADALRSVAQVVRP